jgi:effector-binding domain-containing protein
MYSVVNQITPVLFKRLNSTESADKKPIMVSLSKIISKIKDSVEIESSLPLAANASRFFSHPSKRLVSDMPGSSSVFNKGKEHV